MAHYNKDEHDRNVDTNDISSYLETYFHRDFVYGFLIGTAIGSVIGLVTTLKSKSKADTPSQAPEFNSKIIEQSNREKAIAQQNVEEINRLIDEANEESKHLDATGATAEQEAIKAESSEHGLATPTSKEMTAQQGAIQEEAHDTNDAQEDEKVADTNTAAGIAQAAKGKQQALANDESVKSNTDNLLAEEKPQQAEKDQKAPNLVTPTAKETTEQEGDVEGDTSVEHIDESANPTAKEIQAQQGAIQEEDEIQDESEENNETANATHELTTEGLAQAAKGKQQALADDDTVKSNTANLLHEEKPSPAHSDYQVPHLVTQSDEDDLADVKAHSSDETPIYKKNKPAQQGEKSEGKIEKKSFDE